MGENRRLAFPIFLLLLASECAWAGEPGRLTISQVSVQPPVVNVYLDVVDDHGEPPPRLSPTALSAAIQGEAVKVAQVTSFEASGEGVAYLFLVDISGSIGVSQFAQIRQAIDEWIDGLKSSDRMAIFTFGEQYKQLADFTDDKARLKAVLQTVKPKDRQTKLYLALSNAVNFIRGRGTGLPSRRVIVILSDGKDEGSGITEKDVSDLIQTSHVPIYAIGYSRLPVSEREKYLKVLDDFATLSGGIYSGAASLKTAYEEMQSTIRRLFVVQLDCTGCSIDNQLHALEITLSGPVAGSASLSVNLIAPQPTPPKEPWWKAALSVVLTWKGLLSLLLVVGVSLGVVFRAQLKSWLGWPALPDGSLSAEFKHVEAAIKHFETAVESKLSDVSPIGRRIQLTVLAGKEHRRVDYLNLTGKSVIGRDRGCDASFPDDTEMSGKHCELLLSGEHVEVLDLGSTNGTFLNGAKLVAQQRLEDGDLLRAGRTEFRINFGGGT
ncbi:MAG: VWA domain-containing protein [Candidatus Sulfotelmatobacter sp.]